MPDLSGNITAWLPLVYRQCKGGLGNKGIARDKLKVLATGVCVTLKITGKNPDLIVVFNPA